MKMIGRMSAGLVVVPATGWFLYLLVFKADATVQSALLAFVGMITAAIFTHRSTKRREVEARHFDAKSKGYGSIVALISEMVATTALGQEPLSNQRLMKSIIEFKKVLLVWSDNEVIQAWENFEKNAASSSGENALLLMDDLLRAMRKDLGRDDSRLPRGALVATMLTAEDRAKLRL